MAKTKSKKSPKTDKNEKRIACAFRLPAKTVAKIKALAVAAKSQANAIVIAIDKLDAKDIKSSAVNVLASSHATSHEKDVRRTAVSTDRKPILKPSATKL